MHRNKHAPEGTRWCARCKTYLELSMFSSKACYCGPCTTAYNLSRKDLQGPHRQLQKQKWAMKNPVNRHRTLCKSKYGLSHADYDRMMLEQNYTCAICHKPETETSGPGTAIRQLCCDHDHKTGKVRAFLCLKCNIAFGNVQEDRTIIENMLLYYDIHKDI